MSKRPSLVDFGPVALPGHPLQDGWEAPLSASLSQSVDALKLQRLIAENQDGHASKEFDELAVTEYPSIHQGLRASQGNKNPDVLTCLRLVASIAASTAPVATRVELTLSPEFLPQSSLSVERTCDGLCFDLHVQHPHVIDELSRDLAAIASSVGMHLQIPVKLRLFSKSPPALTKEANWRYGCIE
jgi:hypothetical protein